MKTTHNTPMQSLTASINKPHTDIYTTNQLWIAFVFAIAIYCFY